MSLAFHIVFAALGLGLPVLMAICGLYLRTRRPVFLELSKRWSRGAAILFAVGAVSGTALAFELGLLLPCFMGKAGAIGEVTLILGGWESVAISKTGHARHRPIYKAGAPPITLELIYALILGAVFSFPFLFFLFRIFKTKESY